MIVEEQPFLVLAQPDGVDVAQPRVGASQPEQRFRDLRNQHRRRVMALQHAVGLRFDVAFDFHIGAELVADRVLQVSCPVMRLAQCHGAIDLEVEADREPAADLLGVEMVDGEVPPAGDEHDLLEHGFAVE